MQKKHIDPEQLKIEYLDNQKSPIECSKIFGVSDSLIRRRLLEFNISIRSFSDTMRNKTNIDDNIIIDLYWNQELSLSKTAKQIGRSSNFVKKRLKNSGAGIRTIGQGARKWRNTDGISTDEIIFLYENKEWSTIKISRHFGKSDDFARQRLIAVGHKRRKNTRQFNGSWKGGITDTKNLIRGGTKNLQWRTSIFKRDNYRSIISGVNTRDLQCHHITPFSIIMRSSLTKHKILTESMKNLAIYNDDRFYDLNNGLCVTTEEHQKIEKTFQYGNPWWRLWKCFPEFSISKFGFNEVDFLLFDNDGQINPYNSIVSKCAKKDVSNIVRYEHYLGTIFFHSFILVAKIQNIITGIAVFGKGLNKRLSNDTIELTRLCIPNYVIKPFGCHFLNLCHEYIKENYPNIKELISFADPSVGHNGGIYRMAGWDKIGHGNIDYAYFDTINYQLRHKTSCRRKVGIDKTEKEIAEEKKFIKIKLLPKYRYRKLI